MVLFVLVLFVYVLVLFVVVFFFGLLKTHDVLFLEPKSVFPKQLTMICSNCSLLFRVITFFLLLKTSIAEIYIKNGIKISHKCTVPEKIVPRKILVL